MSRRLAPEVLPEFIEWLTTRRPLGLALTDTQFAVGDATGSAWVMDWQNKVDHLDNVVEEIGASTRRAWAVGGTDVSIALARRLAIDVQTVSWLNDVTTAHNVVRPGIAFEPSRHGAARDAVASARLMAALSEEASAVTRAAVLSSGAQEQLWRPRQARGWMVDLDLLAVELQDSAERRNTSLRELGVDLISTSTDADKLRIHGWLAGFGITVTDRNGKPTLRRDDLDEGSTVPETPEAKQAWEQFRAARSVASRIGKLKEIRRAVRGGRVFSSLATRGARTGRMISRGPALQNLHRDLRPLLIADDGESLVALDLGQVEPRVMAGLSGDQVLATALEAGDVYADLAFRIWGADAKDSSGLVIPAQRDRAKTLLLAIFYGKGVGALSRDLRCSEGEARVLLGQTLGQYPQLAAYAEQLKREMREGRAELTADGRPVPRPQKGEYAVLNNRVQAEAADFFYAAVARVAARVGADRLWLGVHDELVLAVPSNLTEAAKAILEQEMTSTFRGIPIGGKATDLGRSWRKPD